MNMNSRSFEISKSTDTLISQKQSHQKDHSNLQQMNDNSRTPTGSYKKEVIHIVFDLGEGRQETMKVFLDSNPSQLAREFCTQHQLFDEAIPVIEDTIWNNLQSVFNDQSQQSKSNIFERLHKEAQVKAQRRQKQFVNQALQQSNRSMEVKKLNYNAGEELYRRGVQQKEQNEQYQQSRKLEQNQQQHPFRPFVSERSQQLARRPDCSTPDYLLWKGKEMSHRKEQMRSSRINYEQMECPFRPQINVISERITQEKSRNNPQRQEIHERLYQEGLQSIKKKQNDSVQSSQKQKSTNNNNNNNEIPFLERMQISILERQKRLEQSMQQQSQDMSMDQTTGQKLFHPQIGRAPQQDVSNQSIQRNNDHLPIGDYLYQMRIVKDEHHNQLLALEKEETLKQRAKSSDKSNMIFENRKRKQLEELFEVMDSDGDGMISAQQIEISGIQADVLQILAPLLCEMEQINAQLNQEQFFEAANRLIGTLPIVDRDRLLNGLKPKKVLDVEQCTFQPALNKNSLRMVSTRGGAGIHYQNSNKELISIQQKNAEMEQCTFKPNLYNPMKIYDFMLNQ